MDALVVVSIFFRAIWRYVLSYQFMRSLYLQLHLPWTFEFRLPLIFGFQRPWTIPAFGIDFLEQIFTNDPAGAPPTWVFDRVVIFYIVFLLSLVAIWLFLEILDLYEVEEAGEEFEFPIVQDQLENPGGSRSWMQEEFVALEEIAIWERPVDHLTLFYPGDKRKGSGVFKHDYIVIKLACGEFFTLEKVDEAGKYVKFTRGNGTQRGVTRRFSMELKGATVPVYELGHVLGEEGHWYHVLRENCWSYAFNTTHRVIEQCGKDPNLETEKRASLLKDLERLEMAKRADLDTVLKVYTVLLAFITFAILGIDFFTNDRAGSPPTSFFSGVVFFSIMLVWIFTLLWVKKHEPLWLCSLRRLLQCD